MPEGLTDIDMVIFGHSHKYFEKYVDDRLWLNPGSCGKRRFDQEITFALFIRHYKGKNMKKHCFHDNIIVNSGKPVYLTKNGYGAMVVLSLEEYASLTDSIEMKLDEADRQAAMTEERLSHETVFSNVRSAVHGK